MIYLTNTIIFCSRMASHIFVGVGPSLGVRRLCSFFVIGRGAETEVTWM